MWCVESCVHESHGLCTYFLFLFALSWSMWIDVKSMVDWVSVAACRRRALTVRACHENFGVWVSGQNETV